MNKHFWLGVVVGLATPMVFSTGAHYATRNPRSWAGRTMTVACQAGVDCCNTMAGICLTMADRARQAMPVEEAFPVPSAEAVFQIPAEPQPIELDVGIAPVSALTPQDQQRIELIKSFLMPPSTSTTNPLDTIILPCMPKEITDTPVRAGRDTTHSARPEPSCGMKLTKVLMDLAGLGPRFIELGDAAEESAAAAPAKTPGCCAEYKDCCQSKSSCREGTIVCPYSGKSYSAKEQETDRPASDPSSFSPPLIQPPPNPAPAVPESSGEPKLGHSGIDTMEFRPSDARAGDYDSNPLF